MRPNISSDPVRSEAAPASFFTRERDSATMATRQELAEIVIERLIRPGERIFIATGSTLFHVGELILRRVRDVRIATNAVPLAWRFMELGDEGALAQHVSLEIVAGKVNPTTGMVCCEGLGGVACDKLFLAPHGVTRKGLLGNRDVEFLKAAIAVHTRIYLLASYQKLGKDGDYAVKHVGHLRGDIQARTRSYCLVLPAKPPPDFSEQKIAECEELIAWLEHDLGFQVIRAGQTAFMKRSPSKPHPKKSLRKKVK